MMRTLWVLLCSLGMLTSAIAQEAPSVAAPRADANAPAAASEDEAAVPEMVLPAPRRDRFWDSSKDGWYWYRDPYLAGRKKQKSPPSLQIERAKELAQFEQLQKNLEDLRKLAVLNPTEDNVRAYLYFQRTVFEKADKFSTVAQRIAWTDPLFYDAQARPANQTAVHLFDRVRYDKQREHVRSLAKTHGLFFYFRSNCPYCHAFAPILKRFAEQTGLTVYPVSLDGKGLPDFPNPAVDQGSASVIVPGGITAVPAVVLAVPQTGERQIIGFGLMADSELYQRIYALTAEQNLGL